MNQFCDCTYDGWCPRYQRTMTGRFREICAGINCDLGTAAAFREQWLQDLTWMSATQTNTYLNPKQPPIPLLLKQDQAVGDAVAMTAAIYSLHKAHPGKYTTAVTSNFPEVFYHNPDVCNAGPDPTYGKSLLKALPIQMHYPAIHQSNSRGIHFMQGWCEHLGKALNVHVPLLTNRPHLYFSHNQPHTPVGNYWLICSGGKRDFTNKLWGYDRYQEVVDLLQGKINFLQVGEKREDHPPLNNLFQDMVGETTLRGLFNLVRKMRGVVCGVSLLMHVAAALEKPAIVIAGGREPVQWNAYPNQQYLHTVGALPCTTAKGDTGGCWRSRVIPLDDSTELDNSPCLFPQGEQSTVVTPKCMSLISPQRVAELVMCYNQQYDGIT